MASCVESACCMRSFTIASKNVSHTSSNAYLLEDSILKAAASKGFLVPLDLGCDSCPRNTL